MIRKSVDPIPVIDLFAGPGGLGEGFSNYGKQRFRIVLSIEKDPVAYRTLRLRSFYRRFHRDEVPEEYYSVLRGELSDRELFQIRRVRDQAEMALNETWCAELGVIPRHEIDRRIREALKGADTWVLIGGPPCQAYSLAGRSRNKGVKGYRAENDRRHFLYLEYLHVIAEHSPTMFVMENVKGILSSNVKGKPIFQQILNDLEHPHKAVGITGSHSYRIYPLVLPRGDQSGQPNEAVPDPNDYVVRCEIYGVPQARHRVILLGIRDDLHAIEPVRLKPLAESMRPAVKDIIGDMPKLRSGLSSNDSPDEWVRTLYENAMKNCLTTAVLRVAGERVYRCIANVLRHMTSLQYDRGSEFFRVQSDFSNVSNIQLRRSLQDWYLDKRSGGLCNSSTRGHMAGDLSRYLYATCFAKAHGYSPKLSEFPRNLQPNHRNVDTGHFDDRFRVQLSDQRATTITSHISKDGHYYIHYDPHQCRSLTVREAARLQTFPDNYFFCGDRTPQYVQVGNAVPPLLATQIAEILSGVIDRAGII